MLDIFPFAAGPQPPPDTDHPSDASGQVTQGPKAVSEKRDVCGDSVNEESDSANDRYQDAIYSQENTVADCSGCVTFVESWGHRHNTPLGRVMTLPMDEADREAEQGDSQDHLELLESLCGCKER